MIPEIINTFTVVGGVTIGTLMYKGLSSFVYYMKNNRFPAHPAELDRDSAHKTAQFQIHSLTQDKVNLQRQLDKAEDELTELWKKVMNRLP